MTQAIGQEEAKDRGFLEEAPARAGGQIPGGCRVPSPQGGAARQAGAQRGAGCDPQPAAQEAPRGQISRSPGRLVGSSSGALAGRRRRLRPARTFRRRTSENPAASRLANTKYYQDVLNLG